MSKTTTTETAVATETPAPKVVPPVPTGKIAFPLNYAVTYLNTIYTDVPYRRPNGADMRKYANGKQGYGTDLTNLLVDVCELPLAFFDLMDGTDYSALCNEMQPFLTGARKTSTT
jgi:hypothetical protein